MHINKRTCALALAASLALSAAGVSTAFADEGGTGSGAMHASARSTTDYPVHFDFGFYGATQGTDPQWKEDKTSSYLRVDPGKSIDWCYVFIDGGYNGDDVDSFVNRTVNLSTGYSGGSATASNVGEFQIYNRVKEDGNMGWARLTGRAEGPTGQLPGAWSADSWGSYPIINNYY